MARQPRFSLPHQLHCVSQSGYSGQMVFLNATHQKKWLNFLFDAAQTHGVAVHAYAILSQQALWVGTPSTINGIEQVMKSTSRSYARFFNDEQNRTGALWNARYRASIVEVELYFFSALVYMDVCCLHANQHNTTHTAMSSNGHYTGSVSDQRLKHHALVWTLGNTPFAREMAYATLVAQGLNAHQTQEMHDAFNKNWSLGSVDFLGQLQTQTTVRIRKKSAGRPKAEVPSHEKNHHLFS